MRILYLEDLYNYFVSQNKNVKFNANGEDTIVVHIDEPFTYQQLESDDLNLYAPIRLCHTDTNVNKSDIPRKSMEEALDTAYEMPVLAFMFPDPDNEEQLTFAGHEFYENEDGEVVYEEAPVGVVTSKHKLKLVYDEDADKTYLDGMAKIWRTYTKAAEILEREKQFSVSVELLVDQLSFDAKKKVLVLEKFRFSGVTILGKDRYTGKKILPGMNGANISIADFSQQNNSIFLQNEKVIELLSKINDKIDGLNINAKSFRKEEPMKKKSEEEIKDTPSGVRFDGTDDGDGPDYYESEEQQDTEQPETPGENQEPTGEEPPATGNDDPPVGDPVVNEPSPEDIAAAEAVTDSIDALTNDSTAADVSAARAAYDALSADAKSLVTEETLAKLVAQETRITDQAAADAVTTMITALTDSSSSEDVAAARAAYDALTTAQKAYVSAATVAALEAQEGRIDQEAADAVTDAIEALTDESTAEEVEAARQAYDSLTEAQKELVSAETLALLEEQEERISNEGGSNDDKPKKKRKSDNSLKYSINIKGKSLSHFATLSEKLMALTDLVNATYGEQDCTWYCVDADEDTKMVYMHDWWADKHFRQSYSVKKDKFSLVGDRVETFARYMTQDEINAFEKMRADYSAIESELASFKAEPEKQAVLSEECYAQIADTEAYKKLAEQESHFSMSVDEVRAELDKQLLEFAKGHKVEFAAKEEPKKQVGMKLFGNPNKKSTKGSSRYGGLFNKQ